MNSNSPSNRMSYPETLEWMFAKLPMYQRKGKAAFRKDLSNIHLLSHYLDSPQHHFKSIHVGGTNGKGSVSHLLASVFQEAGYKTGLYTSPHLKDFRERIKINGVEIPKKSVIDFIATNKAFLDAHSLSFFEMTVGMAFAYFAQEKVDIAIIEVGLGGRLDATNIIHPEISVITNIGLDHTQFLGNTLAQIAREKAGIIKSKTPIVIGETQQETKCVFSAIAQEKKAPIYFSDTAAFPTRICDLKGVYQEKNKKTAQQALAVAQKLGWEIAEENITQGIAHAQKNTRLRGRWEILGAQPKIICDTGHNKEGLTYVLEQLKKESYQKLYIVMGVVNDKDLKQILPLFPQEAIYFFAKPNIPRGMEAAQLKKEAAQFNLNGAHYSSVKEAYRTAQEIAQEKDLIFVGGSTFTVAEII